MFIQKILTLDEIRALTDQQERQNATITAFNEAVKNQDHETAYQLAQYVIRDEHNALRNPAFSRGWQLHCLKWLVGYCQQKWHESEQGSTEETDMLKILSECIWACKWLVGSLPFDVNESREDLSNAIQFMTELYQDFKISPAMVYKAQMEQSIYMGNKAQAQIHFQQWQNEATDHMNDCAACEQSSLIEYHHFIGNDETVVQLAEPILSGELQCGTVPHATYPEIISSLIQLKQFERAQQILHQAIETISAAGTSFLYLMPKLIQLANHLNLTQLAEQLLDDFSEDIVAHIQNCHFDYLQYLIAVAPFNDDALNAAHALAKIFDERNGNQYYQNMVNLLFVSPVLH